MNWTHFYIRRIDNEWIFFKFSCRLKIDKNHIFELTQNSPGIIIIAKHKFMRIHQILSCKIEDCLDVFLLMYMSLKKTCCFVHHVEMLSGLLNKILCHSEIIFLNFHYTFQHTFFSLFYASTYFHDSISKLDLQTPNFYYNFHNYWKNISKILKPWTVLLHTILCVY